MSSPAGKPESVPSTDTTHARVSIGGGLAERASRLRARFLVTLPFTVAVIALSMVPALQFRGWQWAAAIASLPVVTWGAAPFHRSAWKAGRHGATTMDTLVSVGVIASSLWSWYALLFGGAGEADAHMAMSFLPSFTAEGITEGLAAHAPAAHVYFEGACAIVSFLLAGRMMEARTRFRAGDAVRSLMETGVREVSVADFPLSSPPVIRTVPLSQVQVGDVFLVRPGEKVATDGVVVEGLSAVDASLMTGESLPVDVAPGSQVSGGSVNTWGLVYVRATAVGADTQVAHIAQMVTQAQATKAPIQRVADRVSSVFVPVMVGLSALTLAAWLLAGFPLERAVSAAVAVLVVACPCALGLATPTALLVGSGRAAQLGVVIRRAEVLERSNRIDTVVMDKTGTLTTGVMTLERIIIDEATSAQGASSDLASSLESPISSVADAVRDPDSASEHNLSPAQQLALAHVAGVEASSQHPIARALVRAAEESGIRPLPVSSVRDYPGAGVCARSADGRDVYVGRVEWVRSLGASLSPDMEREIRQAESTGATVVAYAYGRGIRKEAPSESETDGVPPEFSASIFEPLNAVSLPEVSVSLVDMAVEGMTCASCVRRVERKLGKLPGVSASVNLATDSALVTVRGEYTDEELEAMVRAAGYEAHVRSRETRAVADTGGNESTSTILRANASFPAESPAPPHVAAEAAQVSDASPSEFAGIAHTAPDTPNPSSASSLCEEITAAFVIRDRVKDTSVEAVSELRSLGITPVLLSGDHEAAAQFVADQTGIDTVIAGVMPEGKREAIRSLQEAGHVVAMVGDGVNDAPALAQASITGLGIAMGSGTDTAIAVADMTLMNSDPRSAATAIRVARRTLRVIYQNLFWAFAYNVIMIPLAMFGLLTPMIASAAMACSSLCVVANSLRLNGSR